MANCLLQIALICFLDIMIVGGCAIVEHPAMIDLHVQRNAPSIWRLPHTRSILRAPRSDLITFEQGYLGAPSAKPTSLLVYNLPTLRDRISAVSKPPVRKLDVLEGTEADGSFRTNRAKEYPGNMCAAMAASLHDQFRHVSQADPVPGPIPAMPRDMLQMVAELYVPLDPFLMQEIGQDCALFNQR